MNHAEFVAAWRAGEVRIEVDRRRAGAFLAARLLLPFVSVTVIGLGIGLVFWGWLWLGLGVGTLGIVAPRLVKLGAGGFLVAHIADDATLFEGAMQAGALRVVAGSRTGEHAPTAGGET